MICSVLDEDNSGDIDYRELITGLEYFKDSSFEDKLKGKAIFLWKKVYEDMRIQNKILISHKDFYFA